MNQPYRSAEFEYGGEAILMETCVEAPVHLSDDRMAFLSWSYGGMGENGGRRRGGH